ncbi:hypothetical protein [Polyangium mundeleinium]|uniref:Uncharacterized protein n=1 Tax=Polyangium mundeleinium TaxID=2995306 RepID=A0ABT5F298_9BACT|nr:hypothetical protein [Polyangium mundeleinium]MDC0747607.1 hypothetical protein [Polyangium mundeleinium]
MSGERFYMAHPGAFLIPAEHLDEEGIAGLAWEERELLQGRLGFSEEHIALFNRGYRLYRARAASLHARAPGSWLPPRKANLLLVTDPARVRPYAEPFLGTTWFLYASDLDPTRSHEEYVCYQLFHVERLAFLKALRAAVCFNLSYFLDRTEDELHDFSRAASRATRPDAPAFVALARALPWIRTLYHLPLREPPPERSEGLGHVDGADLLIPKEVRPDLLALFGAFDAAAREMQASFFAAQAAASAEGPAPVDIVCRFLAEERPDVVLIDPAGKVVYRPEDADPLDDARAALAPLVSTQVAESLREDLRVVSEKSRAVLASLRNPDVLPRTSTEVDLEGGVYIRADLRRIVYELRQPGFDPLREEAPPYHRQLLAARVVHEWGHLVHEAGLVRVHEARKREYETALALVERNWETIVTHMPARLAEDVKHELEEFGADPASPGPALARVTLARIADYASNVFFRSYLRSEELQSYIRTNVRHHLNEDLGPLAQLARHALELQYLGLASGGDPLPYFLDTSYFDAYFLRTKVYAEGEMRGLLHSMQRLCHGYELDPEAFVAMP